MGSHNQKYNPMGRLFASEINNPLIFDSEITQVQPSIFDVDAYTISSDVFLSTHETSLLPLKLEMKEESDVKRQRLKLISPTPQCLYLSVPENQSPLGLTLRKTPSFLNLVETKLSCSKTSFSMPMKINDRDADGSIQQFNGKTKASNVSASLLRIGSWEQLSRYDAELVAKFYFAKHKLVWEILDCGLKNKIEVLWSDIASLKATSNNDATQTLEIELLRQPRFFCETNPQPRKHTLWKTTADFTGGQASIFRRHFLQFPRGTLDKHYEKLLQLDGRLSSLSKQPFPLLGSPFFSPYNLQRQYPNDHILCGTEEERSIILEGVLESGIDHENEQLHCFTLSTTTIPQQYSDLDQSVASLEMGLYSSGANGNYMGHGASVSTANMLPSSFVSLPPSIHSYNAPDMTEICNYTEKRTDKVQKNLPGNNLGVIDIHDGNLSSKTNTNSTFDFPSSCWISKGQTNKNLVELSEDNDHKSDIGGRYDGLPYLGDPNGNLEGELSGDCHGFLADIFGNTPFSCFVVENEAASNEVRDVLGSAA